MIQDHKQIKLGEEQRELLAQNEEIGQLSPLNKGRMVYICKCLSLGPDYMFFLPAFCCLSFICFIMLYFVLVTSSNLAFILSSILFATLTPVSYVLTACVNPGIYDPYNNIDQKHKYCEQCQVFIPRSVRHCFKCNVCIQGFDHHCPWMSKCIGKGNIYYFYTFMLSMPITVIYAWIALIICFQKQ